MRPKRCVWFHSSIVIASFSLLLGVTPAFAGGFAVQEQSTRGLGQAFAGSTTGYGDGSSAWYNPAAMTQIEGTQFSSSNNLIVPKSNFKNNGSSFATAVGGGAISGNNGGNGGEVGYVPNLYLVTGMLEDRVKFGFALNAPFGLLTKYGSDWVGRYHAVKSDLRTINLKPSVGFAINENISVGGGIDFTYADAELTNAVDFGTVALGALGPSAAMAGLTPGAVDGFSNVQGDDWGIGYTLGVLFSYGDTDFGVAFKSLVDVDLRGDADFDVPTAALPLTATGSFVDTGAVASARLPETITFDLHHQVSDKWGLAFGALWTRWTRLEELRVRFDSPQDDAVTPLGWDNTWRFALGTHYDVWDTMTVRGGVSYEKTPIANGDFRTPRIPDNDRWWATVGFSYAIMSDLMLDFSYAHLFVKDAGSSNLNGTGASLNGEYDLSVDILSASLTWEL